MESTEKVAVAEKTQTKPLSYENVRLMAFTAVNSFIKKNSPKDGFSLDTAIVLKEQNLEKYPHDIKFPLNELSNEVLKFLLEYTPDPEKGSTYPKDQLEEEKVGRIQKEKIDEEEFSKIQFKEVPRNLVAQISKR